MTIPITASKLRPESIMGSTYSRYLSQKVIYWGDNNIITFDTYNRRKYVPTGQEPLMLLNKSLEYRPDLVAFDMYRASELWWYILEANGMKDITEFVSGKTIIIPNIL